MTAEQQLERSVLEGKERDELSAIAQAMSLKTTSRTKKADIIDQILDATGVTSGSNPAMILPPLLSTARAVLTSALAQSVSSLLRSDASSTAPLVSSGIGPGRPTER